MNETEAKLKEVGEWHWFVGSGEDDDEMMMVDSREEAIDLMGEDGCYIVEACFYCDDEQELDSGARDSAPFAKTRNGEWVEHKEKPDGR